MLSLEKDKNPLGVYQVKRGDGLASIGRAVGVPELALVRLNRLTRPPQEGELLLLPEGEFTLLTAAAGDTPSSVAAAYGMRAEEFVLFNGEVVFPGQALLVRKKQAKTQAGLCAARKVTPCGGLSYIGI